MGRRKATPQQDVQEPVVEQITEIELSPFTREAMSVYGSYVLLDRAVADVRDGMKPVQRRILWSMADLGMWPKTNFKKCAKVVGETIGNYHPHGDGSIYSTLVGMVHDRYPLIAGHGNFGGPTDPAAAYRYTECRLTPLAEKLMQDIAVADWTPNYSGDKQEPLVLPSRLPMVLLNGSEGIGVALSANLPPHNLSEVVQAIIHQLKNPNCRLATLLKYIKGPDYGYGVMLSDDAELAELYANGKGTLKYRCSYNFESADDHNLLVITSLAPKFSLGTFLGKMKALWDEGLIEYCSDASSAEGLRILVGFKDAQVLNDRVLPLLYTTDSYQFYCVKRSEADEKLSDKTLLGLDLQGIINEFLTFRRIIETRRITRELELEQTKLARAEGILTAIQYLDIVKACLDKKFASLDALRKDLAHELGVTEEQAGYILDMKVHQLARMNEDDQKQKIKDLKGGIKALKDDLQDIDGVIERHLQELLEFADDRGTVIGEAAEELKVDQTPKWLTSTGSKVLRQAEESPSLKWAMFEYVTQAKTLVTAVYDDNRADAVYLSYMPAQHIGSSKVVGLANDECTKLVALGDDGKLVCIDLPTAKYNVQLIKGALKLVSAVGLRPGDWVAVLGEQQGVCYVNEECTTTRPFVYGSSWVKAAKWLYAMPADASMYDTDGHEIAVEKDGTFEIDTDYLHCIGKLNYCIVDGKKQILDKKAAVAALETGKMTECWIIG